eukprot:gene346-458_t
MDGLKPSQHKMLFQCFKLNLKVAQLADYVSEKSAHRGEVYLTQTIIGMAQNFYLEDDGDSIDPNAHHPDGARERLGGHRHGLELDDSTSLISSERASWTSSEQVDFVLIGGNGQTAKDKEDGPAPGVPFVKDFKENHAESTGLFTATVPPEKLVEFQNEKGGHAKKFKLDGRLMFESLRGPHQVPEEFYKIRL